MGLDYEKINCLPINGLLNLTALTSGWNMKEFATRNATRIHNLFVADALLGDSVMIELTRKLVET